MSSEPIQAREDIQAVPGRILRVAILDDDPSVRIAISRVISASGMVGSCFANWMELSQNIHRFAPDCLIVDLCMPGLDGLEVMNFLRKGGTKVPVILVTAQDDPDLAEICLKAGADAFMRKPLQASELLEVITRLSRRALPG
jgi:FixJ family two-component response regulator